MSHRILIMGAAGKDFHVFNTLYRGRPDIRVEAFTATQIPHITERRYPAALAGDAYPDGIPIHPEEQLETLITDLLIDEVVFAYSDVPYEGWIDVRRKRAEGAGARFTLPSVTDTMLQSTKRVVAVTAVRTGAGKSPTTRAAAAALRDKGRQVAVLRHPMPYGDLAAQAVQRFATVADLAAHDCTIEEMEEYEPHIDAGHVVFAGVDYEAILEAAEKEADVILWDGGNNDTPFINPDLWICVADPLRAGHELTYYPGDINFERADVILINKVDSATAENIDLIKQHAAERNPAAKIMLADLELSTDAPDVISGKRVLCVEDGPTCTHGGMAIGAACVLATRLGAIELVDPRPYLHGELADTFKHYPDIGPLLPAMGYGEKQVRDLEATINATPCDLVLIGTPIDLTRLLTIDKPSTRVRYDLAGRSDPSLADLLCTY